ncbi:uncharacterized protein FFE2_00652 [Fusarium fujikuroi]|nr:uncharacterized protein FFE2_00652 [Fusarium fujikuroi]
MLNWVIPNHPWSQGDGIRRGKTL